MTWHKYTFACDPETCDTLLELTVRDDYGFGLLYNFTCPCGKVPALLSVEDATINNNNEQKEEAPMNATTEYVDTTILALQEAITKKDEYIYRLQDEVSQKSQLVATVRSEMNNFRNTAKEYVIEVLRERQMTQEVAEALAEILDFELSKTLTITATVDFEVEVEVPLDMDADDIVSTLDFSVDSYQYSIDDYNVEIIRTDWSDNIS